MSEANEGIEDLQSGGDQEKYVQEFLARPCTLPDFPLTLSGFDTEEHAYAVWYAVRNYLNIYGRVMNLEKLHQMSIAYEYEKALSDVDQGTKTGHVLTPTKDEFALGIAMAAPILVHNVPYIRLVMHAGILDGLTDPESESFDYARYVLAHECGHIHDLSAHDKAFPGLLLQKQVSNRNAILFGIAYSCWAEYVACRLSARFANEQQTKWLEGTFCKALEVVRVRGKEALLQYQRDRDITRLQSFICDRYGQTMKYASYLIGHVAGAGQQLEEVAPSAIEIVKRKIFFTPIFERLQVLLNEMWECYPNWSSLSVYDPLQSLAEEMLRIAGIKLETMEDGCLYVHVSFGATYFSTANE
jgi:hypothetical protein